MTTRLAQGGRLIERARPIGMRFDGHYLSAFEGDTLASALLANGHRLVGRSFKYHRPRGILASGPEEPNALLTVGEHGRTSPNVRATTEPARDGARLRSQNAWPSLKADLGAVTGLAAPLLPAGFYYKTFIHPRPLWKHLFEPAIRHAAGLGPAPTEPDPDLYEEVNAFCDVLVIGGGIAGLAAARRAARDGARVMLVEQAGHWGGRAPVDGATIDGADAGVWVKDVVQYLDVKENLRLVTRAEGVGLYDHGLVLLRQSVDAEGLRERLWHVRAGHVIVATGAIERPLPFAGNDRPGVMLASAVRDYVANHAVSPGDRTVILTNNDDAYRTALTLLDAGLGVPAVLDVRAKVDGPLPRAVRDRGVPVHAGRGIAKVLGRDGVRGVATCLQAGEGAVLQEIACDCVAVSGGWSPAVHLWSHCGGRTRWDDERAMVVPDPDHPPRGADGGAMATVVGSANGKLTTAEVLADVGSDVRTDAEPEAPILAVRTVPAGAPPALQSKMFIDLQNDVKVSDLRLAAREGFESVEHAKRYTTLGMATDQGKTSNVPGLMVLADARGASVGEVGTTTFRPPWTPVTFGTLAGEAKGQLFQPTRRTPMDAAHDALGATWEPVGLWRRPYCYPRAGETDAQAVAREVKNARQAVGILDASTLGKFLVRGPDAGWFVDMLYTNMMSTLAPGRCRYGVMCDEQGFVMDDGVVARLDDDTWLCHTTTGGAGRIQDWMEDWLQTEWWDRRVHVVDLTERFAQVAVAGPNARALLERLGGVDLSNEALPFMRWTAGNLGGFDARVFRISFSGELAYEVAVPASRGPALWDALPREGADLGVMPYGTEALHVMRAEKGFVMIGDETDGTVTPHDVGLGWAVSRKKDDFLGCRGMRRHHLTAPDRWRLVGLETLDGSVLPDGAHAIGEGHTAVGQRRAQGRVTSTYHSPTLGRGIAMALVERGPERMGEVLRFTGARGRTVEARIVNPVFFDPEGARRDG